MFAISPYTENAPCKCCPICIAVLCVQLIKITARVHSKFL